MLIGAALAVLALVALLAGLVPASVELAGAMVSCAVLLAVAAVGAEAGAGAGVLAALTAWVLVEAVGPLATVAVFGLTLAEQAAKPTPTSALSARAFNAKRIIGQSPRDRARNYSTKYRRKKPFTALA